MREFAPLHVGISVYDMDESLQWYKDNLGFDEIVYDEYVKDLRARLTFIRNGDFELELFQYDEPRPLPPDRFLPNEDLKTVGTKHVALYTNNLKAALARFEENGVDVVFSKQMDGEPMCFIRDNSGVLIEIIQKKGEA